MNNTGNFLKKLPYELVNTILDYDGRIKYKYKYKNTIDYQKLRNGLNDKSVNKYF